MSPHRLPPFVLNLSRVSWASLFTGCVFPDSFDRSLSGGRATPAWERSERWHELKAMDHSDPLSPPSLPLPSN